MITKNDFRHLSLTCITGGSCGIVFDGRHDTNCTTLSKMTPEQFIFLYKLNLIYLNLSLECTELVCNKFTKIKVLALVVYLMERMILQFFKMQKSAFAQLRRCFYAHKRKSLHCFQLLFWSLFLIFSLTTKSPFELCDQFLTMWPYHTKFNIFRIRFHSVVSPFHFVFQVKVVDVVQIVDVVEVEDIIVVVFPASREQQMKWS